MRALYSIYNLFLVEQTHFKINTSFKEHSTRCGTRKEQDGPEHLAHLSFHFLILPDPGTTVNIWT